MENRLHPCRTEEQNTARQEILLRDLGVDELFIDKASGKNANRPELARMMNYVRRGDTVIVESISRFARNTRDLLDLVERLTEKAGRIRQPKGGNRHHDANRQIQLTVFAAVAELEREYILQRQREGIAIAREQGKYTGPQAAPPPRQLRAGSRTLACRRNYRHRGYAADRVEAEYVLPPVCGKESSLRPRKSSPYNIGKAGEADICTSKKTHRAFLWHYPAQARATR